MFGYRTESLINKKKDITEVVSFFLVNELLLTALRNYKFVFIAEKISQISYTINKSYTLMLKLA